MRSRTLTIVAVLVAAFLLVTNPVVSEAAGKITGKQIKNGSVTGKDVKDGSLETADVSAGALAQLRGNVGPAGPAGATGPAGASAFAPPPVGTVVKGGGLLSSNNIAANEAVRMYTPLPVVTRTPLVEDGPGRNLWFGGSSNVPFAGQKSGTRCGGSFVSPTAAPGNLCVYIGDSINAYSGILLSGADSGVVDGAEDRGFILFSYAVSNGDVVIPYTWAYTAG